MGQQDQGLRDWSNPSYLRTVAGRRTVPVEMGGCYTGEGWRQELMTVGDFIGRFIESDAGDVSLADKDAGPGSGRQDGGRGGLKNGASRHFQACSAQKGSHASKGRAYLAQHQLFDQIPTLRRDIVTPDYCALLLADEEDNADAGSVVTNAWFGPAGTVSPLHNDPFHNLLAQVVGTKRVRVAVFPADLLLFAKGNHALRVLWLIVRY